MVPSLENFNGLELDAKVRLEPLYQCAQQEAGLTATDLYSVDDLLDLSGLGHVESLHALLLAMFVALNEGSPCVEVGTEALSLLLADLAGAQAGDLAGQIVKDLDSGAYAELIGQDVQESKPIILHNNGKARFLYFQKFLKHELATWELLQQRFHADPSPLDGEKASKALAEMAGPAGHGQALDADQQFALALALLRPIAIISGGPGTGKTSIIGSLLRCLVRLGCPAERIGLAAPTGRAAQRLTDAIRAGLERLPSPLDPADKVLKDRELKAVTLHQLLAYSPTSGLFRHHQENPLPLDVLIVDEVSMVGLTLLAQLLHALPAQARLVLLGDHDQLPSVEAGSWLSHLSAEGDGPAYSKKILGQVKELLPGLKLPMPVPGMLCDALAVLRQNYRSEPRIRELAARVNQSDESAVDALPRLLLGRGSLSVETPSAGPPTSRAATSLDMAASEGGCWLLEPMESDLAWWRDVLRQWADLQYLSTAAGPSFRDQAGACRLPADPEALSTRARELQRLFAIVEGTRILTLLREGPWGAAGINQHLAQLVRPAAERGFLFPGAPVLLTRNDHDRQLYNGDVGLALRAEDGALRVVFPRHGSYVALSADALPACEYGFALTVHKSQGSEYGQVLFVLPPQGGRHLLTRELVYTGLTRARRLAILCGPASVLQAAVSRKVRRVSGVIGPSAVSDQQSAVSGSQGPSRQRCDRSR